MSGLFIKLFNMSVSASWLILAALAVRLVLKKAPKRILVAVWALVAIRLVLPFSIKSPTSLVPSERTIELQPEGEATLTVSSGFPLLNSVFINEQPKEETQTGGIGGIVGQDAQTAPAHIEYPEVPAAEKKPDPKSLLEAAVDKAGYIWALGAGAMLVYCAASYIGLNRRVRGAERIEGNVYETGKADTAFVLGVIKPRIYLPKSSEIGREYAHMHERAHIARGDHIWKLLGFIVLSLHWFNPLVVLGYILLCRDIESACDEKVVSSLGANERADYSQALLDSSLIRNIAACPLAFGGMGTKKRIRDVLNYKKPAFWLIALALIVICALIVFFMTGPIRKQKAKEAETVDSIDRIQSMRPLSEVKIGYTAQQAAEDGCVVVNGSELIAGEKIWLDFCNAAKDGKKSSARVYQYYPNDNEYWVKDISFDGERYKLELYDRKGDTNEEFLYSDTFKHLIRSEYTAKYAGDGGINVANSTINYILSDDENMTADKCFSAMISSYYPPVSGSIAKTRIVLWYLSIKAAMNTPSISDAPTPPYAAASYTPDMAAADGCVVWQGDAIIAGGEQWVDYYKRTQAGEPAKVRVYKAYTDNGGELTGYTIEDHSYENKAYGCDFWDYRANKTGGNELARRYDLSAVRSLDCPYKYLVRSVYFEEGGQAKIVYLYTDDAGMTASKYYSGQQETVGQERPIAAEALVCSTDMNDLISEAYDVAYIDVDGDGVKEKCTLGFGPTSGLYSFTFNVYKDGEQVCGRIYAMRGFFAEMGFVKDKNGEYRVVGLTQQESNIHMVTPETLELYHNYSIVRDENGEIDLDIGADDIMYTADLNTWGSGA